MGVDNRSIVGEREKTRGEGEGGKIPISKRVTDNTISPRGSNIKAPTLRGKCAMLATGRHEFNSGSIINN